eukprot:CAMPEP_0173393922 /NCGR_PEP_ID=MMETSP1356-20130122/23021_1 /TAXON_ID=77927 ORGANISM="Hemiselmis virescens, Strain PCC157" /NCGR_SAMPLE_ID=MMETSP1356 /ASSEMBLY_ACC=CAM_ASM_000847 /LENGTH=199 /DNA_ID=CAMNT_0014352041 /DNA_START=54 /DNA_END=653 /DNA_ORIENTATION=+
MSVRVTCALHQDHVEHLAFNKDLSTWDERNNWKKHPKLNLAVYQRRPAARPAARSTAPLPVARRILELREQAREKVVEPFCCRYSELNARVTAHDFFSDNFERDPTPHRERVLMLRPEHALAEAPAWKDSAQRDFDELVSELEDESALSPFAGMLGTGEKVTNGAKQIDGDDDVAKKHHKHLHMPLAHHHAAAAEHLAV